MVILGMVYGIGKNGIGFTDVYHMKRIAIHPDPPGVSMEERFACWDARIDHVDDVDLKCIGW